MSLSHQASKDIVFNAKETSKNVWKIPVCTDDSLIYAKRNQSYLTTFDTNVILNSLEGQLLQGQEQVSLQFANQADYDQMVADVVDNQARYHNLFSHYWDNYSGFSYGLLAETLSITFTNST